MNTPHVHAALIKAWADGAILEVFHGTWQEVSYPTWNKKNKYRIKPPVNTIKFRNYLFKHPDYPGSIGVHVRDIHSNPEKSSPYFIKWLGDWQEYTIEEPIVFNNPSYMGPKENCTCRSVHNCNCK